MTALRTLAAAFAVVATVVLPITSEGQAQGQASNLRNDTEDLDLSLPVGTPVIAGTINIEVRSRGPSNIIIDVTRADIRRIAARNVPKLTVALEGLVQSIDGDCTVYGSDRPSLQGVDRPDGMMRFIIPTTRDSAFATQVRGCIILGFDEPEQSAQRQPAPPPNAAPSAPPPPRPPSSKFKPS